MFPDYSTHVDGQVASLIGLENKDIFHAPLAGSTVIILYLFREVSGRTLCCYAVTLRRSYSNTCTTLRCSIKGEHCLSSFDALCPVTYSPTSLRTGVAEYDSFSPPRWFCGLALLSNVRFLLLDGFLIKAYMPLKRTIGQAALFPGVQLSLL